MSVRLIVLSVCAFALVNLPTVFAQVMQSGSYQIQSDSINTGGGLSGSNNYLIESTAGEIATGISDSDNFSLRAGYQQMQEVYLALSGGGNVSMSGDIAGIVGGTSYGSTTFTATTDSAGGYQMTIAATENPAMQSAEDTIPDYTPAGGAPDLHFVTDATDAHFGYSPFGAHVVERFQTNGSACAVSGSASSTACWDGLSTTPETIAQTSNANHPNGTETTVYFRVGIGSSVIQTAGTYTATSTVTLIAL